MSRKFHKKKNEKEKEKQRSHYSSPDFRDWIKARPRTRSEKFKTSE